MLNERWKRWLEKAWVLLLLSSFPWSARAQDFDVLIRGGRVLDGSGNPAFTADVGIRGDVIAAIGKLDAATAKRTINATGLFVVPGFIDMHSHAGRSLVSRDQKPREAHNLVAQGITTVVGGADGRNSTWPIRDEMAAYRDPGVALNIVLMVDQATVRGRVMKADYERAATPEEIRQMKALVRQGMEEGAWGLGAASAPPRNWWSWPRWSPTSTAFTTPTNGASRLCPAGRLPAFSRVGV